ncbi:MAG: CBS domain-containing protein [bacterium]|nr:CBS domain-containing protein [bacterium]
MVHHLSERPVKTIMNKNLVVAPEETTVFEAAKLMKNHNIRSILAGSKKKVAGILTERDIIQKVLAEKLNPAEVKIEEIMAVTLKTVYHSTPIHNVYREMGEEGVRHLVVVDSSGPVGMVSVTDLISLEAEEAEEESR